MLEKIREILVEQLDLDPEEIVESASFRDDLGVDSLDLYELALNLEDEYSLEIPVEDLQKMNTVRDVIEYLNNHGIEE